MNDETALDVETLQRWRADCFYPKADLPLADAVMRTGATATLDGGEVEHACSKVLHEPVNLEPLDEQGTFHRAWRCRTANGESLIVRANVLSRWFRDYPMWIDAHVGRLLHLKGLPVVKRCAIDISRESCDWDLLVEAEAKGTPLKAFDADEEKITPLLRDLGRVLARVHRHTVEDGFGLFDVAAMMEGRGQLFGSHATWDDYLRTKLDEHLATCVDIDAITKAEAKRIVWMFDGCRGIYTSRSPKLLHGDPGSHNVFTDGRRITALIDWEDAVAGDPVYEIAFWATFHPERRHAAFLEGYRDEGILPADFEQRFWLYYVRIALAKTVLRHRLGIADRPGRAPASERIRDGLRRLEAACSAFGSLSRMTA